MSILQLNPADGVLDYEAMLNTLIAAYTGKPTITLTNYDNDLAPQVTAGSIFEVGGALFSNNALATPTNYASISVSTTFYIYYDESAGIFVYSETVPAWSDAKQGWYNSADRAFFSMFKDSGGTLYQLKTFLVNQSLGRLVSLVLNTLKVNDTIQYDTRPISSNKFFDNSGSEQLVFDKLSPFVPNTGDIIECHGMGYKSSKGVVFNRAVREPSGVIRFNGLDTLAAGAVDSVTAIDTFSTTLLFSASW